jgi:hypothetical protein
MTCDLASVFLSLQTAFGKLRANMSERLCSCPAFVLTTHFIYSAPASLSFTSSINIKFYQGA